MLLVKKMNRFNIMIITFLEVVIRAVESESREKSKNRKKSEKIGKIGIHFLLDFLAIY